MNISAAESTKGAGPLLSSVSHNELVVIGLLNNETSVIEFINSRRFMSNELGDRLTRQKNMVETT